MKTEYEYFIIFYIIFVQHCTAVNCNTNYCPLPLYSVQYSLLCVFVFVFVFLLVLVFIFVFVFVLDVKVKSLHSRNLHFLCTQYTTNPFVFVFLFVFPFQCFLCICVFPLYKVKVHPMHQKSLFVFPLIQPPIGSWCPIQSSHREYTREARGG